MIGIESPNGDMMSERAAMNDLVKPRRLERSVTRGRPVPPASARRGPPAMMALLIGALMAWSLAGTSLAQAPDAPVLRYYSDDAELAQHLTTAQWRTPEDGYFDVLALSGGGPNGAFGAGVLSGWTERGDRPNFDHVTGVSTGALIAPFAFLGPDWDDELRTAYLDERTEGLMRRRLLAGLFSHSIFSGRPLLELVDSYVTQDLVDAVAAESESGRTLIVVTTDLRQQRSVAWDMGAIARLGGEPARTLFRDVMLASASIPGVFPPVMIDTGSGDEMHVDGGIAAPIYAVPEALADRHGSVLGAASPLRIFMIANISVAPVTDDVEDGTVAILQRSLATSGKASMRATLQMNAAAAERYGAEFRLISIPAGQSVPITDFAQTSMQRLFDLGRQMGVDNDWRDRVIE